MGGRVAGRGLVWLVVAGVLGSCASAPRSLPPPVEDTGGSGPVREGLSGREREDFYHLPQGNEHLWLAVLRALPSRDTLEGRTARFQSFLEGFERFGFLPDPAHPERLPVGVAFVPATERQPVARVGINCAACHVGEFHHRGARIRVDGAPSLLNMDAFNREAVEVMALTLGDRTRLLEFLERLATHLPAQAREGGLQAAYPDTDLTSDGSSSAREKLVAVVTWYCGQDPAMCGPPKLGPEPERGLEFDAQLSLYVRELSRKQVRTVPDAIRLLRGHLLYFMRLGRLKFGTYAGPGRVDAFGVARGVLFGP